MRYSFVLIALIGMLGACTHPSVTDPAAPDPNDPLVTSPECDPDTVYFENQILPLLIGNCTESGCHNAQDHEEGVDLSSYAAVLTTVEHVLETDWSENKLIRSLTDNDPDDRMPYGKAPLAQDQIEMIKTWIKQGARNNGCNDTGICNTDGLTYNNFAKALIQNRCLGCHAGSSPSAGVSLATYADAKKYALNGKFFAAVNRTTGWMPQGGPKLSDCNIQKIKAWGDNGAPEN